MTDESCGWVDESGRVGCERGYVLNWGDVLERDDVLREGELL